VVVVLAAFVVFGTCALEGLGLLSGRPGDVGFSTGLVQWVNFCMKPFRSILPLLLVAPAVFPLVGAVASNPSVLRDPSEPSILTDVPLPTQDTSLRSSNPGAVVAESSLEPSQSSASSVRLSGRLVDSLAQSKTSELIALDPEPSRRSPMEPPPVPASAVVRFGDTLLKISQRYGLTIAELLRLNPGLDTARLVVGSQVQVVQSSPSRSRMLLGLAPVGSGGLSWPELPQFGESRRPLPGRGTANLAWPAQGIFTSGYGWRWGRMHKGIDIANNVGTPIVAAARGRVTFSGWHDGGYGYLVEITHEDGSLTRYGHNSRLLVREGEQVDQGQTISQMGSTGRSTGPHLHFEVLLPGEGAMNPMLFLSPRA
jgi:LysM repeat protein